MDYDLLRRLLTGLAAGDSLGSTSEFTPKSEVPRVYEVMKEKGWPFRQVGGGASGWMPGEPTDDTDMAMCMVRSFIQRGGFDPVDIAGQFVSWMRKGPVDIGATTMRTLSACEAGHDYWAGGLRFWREKPEFAANGSLMRNGVIAAMAEKQEDAFSNTLKAGMITHYAPLPQLCCLAQTYLIRELLERSILRSDWIEGFGARVEDYFREVRDPEIMDWKRNVNENGAYSRALDAFFSAGLDASSISGYDPFSHDYRRGAGYCLLTLKIALWGLYWSLEPGGLEAPEGFPAEVFLARGPSRLAWVTMIGHDSDTYAAVAGALMTAAHSELPAGFTDGLKALEEFQGLVRGRA